MFVLETASHESGATESLLFDDAMVRQLKSVSESRSRLRSRLNALEHLLGNLSSGSRSSGLDTSNTSLHVNFDNASAHDVRQLLSTIGWTGETFYTLKESRIHQA